MGKKITFIGFLLAMLCLLPAGVETLVNNGGGLSVVSGIIAVVGFPLFSLVSFIGMAIWAITEIRRASAHDTGPDK